MITHCLLEQHALEHSSMLRRGLRLGHAPCASHAYVAHRTFSSSACVLHRRMGLQSLPVAFGVETAKWITVGTIDVTQFSVAAYLAFGLHEPVYAAVLTALILPQARLYSKGGHGGLKLLSAFYGRDKLLSTCRILKLPGCQLHAAPAGAPCSH